MAADDIFYTPVGVIAWLSLAKPQILPFKDHTPGGPAWYRATYLTDFPREILKASYDALDRFFPGEKANSPIKYVDIDQRRYGFKYRMNAKSNTMQVCTDADDRLIDPSSIKDGDRVILGVTFVKYDMMSANLWHLMAEPPKGVFAKLRHVRRVGGPVELES